MRFLYVSICYAWLQSHANSVTRLFRFVMHGSNHMLIVLLDCFVNLGLRFQNNNLENTIFKSHTSFLTIRKRIIYFFMFWNCNFLKTQSQIIHFIRFGFKSHFYTQCFNVKCFLSENIFIVIVFHFLKKKMIFLNIIFSVWLVQKMSDRRKPQATSHSLRLRSSNL
jgi:hypothetical protein